MQLFSDLFASLLSTDYGLMSFVVIVLTIVIWIYFTILFLGKIGKSTPPAAEKASAVTHEQH